MRYGRLAGLCALAATGTAQAAAWDERRITGLERKFGAEVADMYRRAGEEAAQAVLDAGHPCGVISTVVMTDGVADRLVLCDGERLYEYLSDADGAVRARPVERDDAPALLRGKYRKE